MSGLSCDEMADQILGRLAEFSATYNGARGLIYRRIGYRQRQLYAIAGPINPERFGNCATAALTGGVANLATIAAPVFTPETITQVIVNDPGSSTSVQSGDIISIVPIDDLNSEMPPRATLRDRVLAQVGSDLSGVNTINIYYSRLTALLGFTDAATLLELEAPYDTLLEIDGAIWLLPKCKMSNEDRAAAAGQLKEEERALLVDFKTHVQNYGPLVSRSLSNQLVHPDPARGT